jgi:hypothetical protein
MGCTGSKPKPKPKPFQPKFFYDKNVLRVSNIDPDYPLNLSTKTTESINQFMKTQECCTFLQACGLILQIAFCIDSTGTMTPFIEDVKKAVLDVIEQSDGLKLYSKEFAIVAYKDHDYSDVFIYNDFSNAYEISNFIIQKIKPEYGKDYPEAVLTGLNACVDKLSWKKNSYKIVFHLADAPPHGEQYKNQIYKYHDLYIGRCPSVSTVSDKFVTKDINYSLIDCNEENEDPLREMKHIFSHNDNFGIFRTYKISEGHKMSSILSKLLKDRFKRDKPTIRQIIRGYINSNS